MSELLDPAGDSSWKEMRRINPTDTKLRKHGFSIAARPANEEPLWFPPFREGIPQSIALEIVAWLEGKKKEPTP